MEILRRPPTKKMISQLFRARDIEQSQNRKKICLISDFDGSLPGLSKRGLISCKWVIYEGKEVMKICLTEGAYQLLENYEQTKD